MPESGVITGPPDFIGVGTQRSGTTWMQRLLRDHPRIRLPRDQRKEQHFFDWFGKTEMTDADVARYHEQFPRPPGDIAGDWTPRYMRDVWTPRLIPRAAPDAKILVIFRDPVERYRSGVLHMLARQGRAGRDVPRHRRGRARPVRAPAQACLRLLRPRPGARPPVRARAGRAARAVPPHARVHRAAPGARPGGPDEDPRHAAEREEGAVLGRLQGCAGARARGRRGGAERAPPGDRPRAVAELQAPRHRRGAGAARRSGLGSRSAAHQPPRDARPTSSASAPRTPVSTGGTGCCSSTLRSRRPCAVAASTSSTSSASAR